MNESKIHSFAYNNDRRVHIDKANMKESICTFSSGLNYRQKFTF